jgi:hypothetical protein
MVATERRPKSAVTTESAKPEVAEDVLDPESGLYTTSELPDLVTDQRPWIVIRASAEQAFDGARWSGDINVHQVRNLLADCLVSIIAAENPVIVSLYQANAELRAENERLKSGMKSAGISPAPRRKKVTEA